MSADWRFHATEAALLQVTVDILGVEVIVPSWLQSFLLTALRTAAYASGFSVLVYLELVCLEGLSWASCSFFFFTADVFDIVRRHAVSLHIFTDDRQSLYNSAEDTIRQFADCLCKVDA